jgi:poly-beta-1,6-N-acetyl-D-glucosamine synthase
MFFNDIFSDTLLFSFFILYAFFFLIQMIYYWGIFSKLAFYKKKPLENRYQPVSVVICAKNEYTNLKKNLHFILEQDYPDFEVVVVNDCSDDDSKYLLKSMAEAFPRLNVVTILKNVNFFTGKKFALALGIKSAKHDIVLLTDADCAPKSNRWIAEMQNNFKDKTEIVLGYSGFEQKKGFADKLVRFDAITTAMQYLSWSLAGMTYMGVGRNLAYKKEIFFRNKGFTSHYQIVSGDDDLFINQVAKKRNTNIEITRDSQTYSLAKSSFSEWLKQKKRHYSTGIHYKTSHKIVLGLFVISNFLFYFFLIFLLTKLLIFYSIYNICPILVLWALRVATQMIVFKKTMNKLGENKLLLISPLLDFLFVLINPMISFSNVVVKQNKWK